MTPKDSIYPIVALERYREGSVVVGMGSGQGARMTARYGVVLRAEFVRANCAVGHNGNVCKNLYFKVLPKGTADVPGILLGYPTLDAPPYGLGWHTCETTHFFSAMQIHMPRAELVRRIFFFVKM